MKPHVGTLTLRELGPFEDAELPFVAGINVFIGTNATGKSFALKALYSLLKATEPRRGPLPRRDRILEKLARVFVPDEFDVSRLVRRRRGANRAMVAVSGHQGATRIEIVTKAWKDKLRLVVDTWQSPAPALFVPSREALTIYKGFVALYERQELTFDETYYDLCVALGALKRRGPQLENIGVLLRPLEKAIGAKVMLVGDEFYLQVKTGRLEAPLVAEGFRKLASLAHLVANGSLVTNGFLLWDEPEANLNPSLVELVAKVLLELGRQGVQVFVATHDFLLTHHLSLISEYGIGQGVDVRFFLFDRERPEGAVNVQHGSTLADLPANPIAEQFTKHYDFERGLFTQRHSGKELQP